MKATLVLPTILLLSLLARAEDPEPDAWTDPVGWKKTLAEARLAASAKSGYALILVTGAGKASERMETAMMSRPAVYEKLRDEYGCVKGAPADLSKDEQAKSRLAEAGVTEGPAIVLIEPADGSIVDVTRVELSTWQFQRLLEDVDRGATQKALEARAKDESGNAEFRLKSGRARMRKVDFEGARRDFEAAMKSDQPRVGAESRIGLAGVALASRDFKSADRLLKEASGMLVEEEEAKEFESPLAEANYLMALSAWEQDLRDDATRHAQKVLTVWPMSPWMQFLCCKGEELGWDWYEGKEVAR